MSTLLAIFVAVTIAVNVWAAIERSRQEAAKRPAPPRSYYENRKPSWTFYQRCGFCGMAGPWFIYRGDWRCRGCGQVHAGKDAGKQIESIYEQVCKERGIEPYRATRAEKAQET